MALTPCPECAKQVSDQAFSCPNCGYPIKQAAANQPERSQPQNSAQLKSPGAAAVLSALWCGLGQIYNGEIGKGVLMGIAYVVSFALIYVLVGIVTTPILWILGIADAYGTAERLNREVLGQRSELATDEEQRRVRETGAV